MPSLKRKFRPLCCQHLPHHHHPFYLKLNVRQYPVIQVYCLNTLIPTLGWVPFLFTLLCFYGHMTTDCQCGRARWSLSSSSLRDLQIEAQRCFHPSYPPAMGRLSLAFQLIASVCAPMFPKRAKQYKILKNQGAFGKCNFPSIWTEG